MTRILAALTVASALTKLTWTRTERWLRRRIEPIVMAGFDNPASRQYTNDQYASDWAESHGAQHE